MVTPIYRNAHETGDIIKMEGILGWDAFKATIHNGKYSPIDKMNYLKSGKALDAMLGYQLSNINYEVVVDVLKRQFGNTQIIIEAHCHNLTYNKNSD